MKTAGRFSESPIDFFSICCLFSRNRVTTNVITEGALVILPKPSMPQLIYLVGVFTIKDKQPSSVILKLF